MTPRLARACDRSWEVFALREGRLSSADAVSFDRHCAVCDACRSLRAGDARLQAMARALPVREPDALEVRRMRQRILRIAAGEAAAGGFAWPALRSRGSKLAAMAAVLGAVATGWAATGPLRHPHLAMPTSSLEPREGATTATVPIGSPAPASPPAQPPAPAPFASTVDAEGGARWSRRAAPGLEVVTLEDGALALAVRRRAPGERFLVALPDGEIEVRGTRFSVHVEGGHTCDVAVEEGLVALRVTGVAEVFLHAGERWQMPLPVAAQGEPRGRLELGETPAKPPHGVVAAGGRSSTLHDGKIAGGGAEKRSPRGPSAAIAPRRVGAAAADTGAASDTGAPAASLYDAGATAYAEGRASDATAALRAFLRKSPSAPEAEDASFMIASALSRLGDRAGAARAAEAFLARYPGSLHARDAATLVARGGLSSKP